MEGEGIARKVTLNDGNKMPMFGLGVYKASQEDTVKAVKFALQSGYRLIDTAAFYRNEAEVGQAIKESGVKREDVFVVTKLQKAGHGYEECLEAFNSSLKKLDVTYVDLYLIHHPKPGRNVESYKAMMKLKEQGLIKSIGVSNFGVNHLKEMKKAGLPTPAVNQIELNPYWRLEDIVNYCKEKGIALMGYCPMFQGQKNDDPILTEMASRYEKTVPQLLIRWSVQKNYITIPKSTKLQRILENTKVFDFTINDKDMRTLNSMPTEQCIKPLANVTECPWKG